MVRNAHPRHCNVLCVLVSLGSFCASALLSRRLGAPSCTYHFMTGLIKPALPQHSGSVLAFSLQRAACTAGVASSVLPSCRSHEHSLLHSAWPVMLQSKGVGRARTRCGAMEIILASAQADRNCAERAAAAQIIRAAVEEVAKQRAGHPKRLANPALWGCGFLFWRRSWTTSLGPTRRS